MSCACRQPSLDFPVSPLLTAFPYISSATPLSSAFTHFKGAGGVVLLPADLRTCRRFDMQRFCFQWPAASLPSLCSVFDPRFLCFQQLRDTFLQIRGVGHKLWLTTSQILRTPPGRLVFREKLFLAWKGLRPPNKCGHCSLETLWGRRGGRLCGTGWRTWLHSAASSW